MRRCLVLLLAAALLLPMAAMTGCADAEARPPDTPLRTKTVIERRATLSILRRAWDGRPRNKGDAQFWYERRLLDRSGLFGRKIRDTETYVDACQFWMRCVREHLEVYDDKDFKVFRGR